MIIDIIFVILLVIALWKGYSRGFIIAIFSFIAIFIGLAAAVKFSVVVSAWLHNNTNIGTRWLPFISFLAVIIVVIILVRWIAGLIQTSVEFAMLGWLNRLGGIVLYVALYAMVYSIILFYATQMGIIKTEAIALQRSGFFSTETIRFKGEEIIPLQYTSSILLKEWRLQPNEEEFTVMKVIVSGNMNGSPRTVEYTMLDRFNVATQTSSMSRTTG